jgi:hypothetical protein
MFAPFLQKYAAKSPTLLRAVSWALEGMKNKGWKHYFYKSFPPFKSQWYVQSQTIVPVQILSLSVQCIAWRSLWFFV